MHASVKYWLSSWPVVLFALVLSACATQPPEPVSSAPALSEAASVESGAARLGLQLAPADLGRSLSLQQHLKVERNGRIDELDAALEVDEQRLQLVGLAFGQRVLSMEYDGEKLTSWRHFMLPEKVRAEEVLEDIQLTLWPLDAIKKRLPLGWRIEDSDLTRTLYKDEEVICRIHYSAMPRWSGIVTLENLRYHYTLTIQSLLNDASM